MKQILAKRLKRTLLIVIGITILTVIPGCSNQNQSSNQTKTTESPSSEPTSTATTVTTSLQPTSAATSSEGKSEEVYIDTASENLGALVFMGASLTEKEIEQRKQQILDEYLTDVNESKENKNEEFTINDCGGEELFCIVSHYVDSSITVERAELSDDGELEAKETLVTSDKPIIIQCNESDLYSNVIITIKHKEDSVTFSPFISLMDGSVTPVDRLEVIDITNK